MKKCDYCGCENLDDATHCRECGTDEFVTAAPEVAPVQLQTPPAAEPEFPEMEPDVPPDGESALCTCCLFPNVPDVGWCKRCAAPIGPTAMLLPMGWVSGMGHFFRGCIRGRPKPVVMVGVCVLFLPRFFVFGKQALKALDHGELLMLVFWLFCCWVCYFMLYKVTSNYLRIPKREWNEADTDL